MEWPHWSVYLVLAGAWLWQNCVHELSHLIAIWRYQGKKPLGFYPYPHRHDGHTYFARLKCEPYILPGHPYIHTAPLFGAAVQLGVVVVCIGLFLQASHWHSLVLVLVPLVDVVWWIGSYFWGRENSDGKRYRVAIDYLTKP